MVAELEIPAGELKMPAAKLGLAINAHLPPDIRVMQAARCPREFDS